MRSFSCVVCNCNTDYKSLANLTYWPALTCVGCAKESGVVLNPAKARVRHRTLLLNSKVPHYWCDVSEYYGFNDLVTPRVSLYQCPSHPSRSEGCEYGYHVNDINNNVVAIRNRNNGVPIVDYCPLLQDIRINIGLHTKLKYW